MNSLVEKWQRQNGLMQSDRDAGDGNKIGASVMGWIFLQQLTNWKSANNTYLEVFKNCWLIVLGGTPMQTCQKDVTYQGDPNWVDGAAQPCVPHPCSHPYLSIANELMLF
jgi:hypothetical protein